MGLPKKRIEKGIFPVSDSLTGGLAQLARALDLHSRGQGFDSLILHKQRIRGFLKVGIALIWASGRVKRRKKHLAIRAKRLKNVHYTIEIIEKRVLTKKLWYLRYQNPSQETYRSIKVCLEARVKRLRFDSL